MSNLDFVPNYNIKKEFAKIKTRAVWGKLLEFLFWGKQSLRLCFMGFMG